MAQHSAEPLYLRELRPAVHRQPRHAVAKGFDLQADMAFGPLTIELATGYTSARYTENAPADCTRSSGSAYRVWPLQATPSPVMEGINYGARAPCRLGPWPRRAIQLQVDATRCVRGAWTAVREPESVAWPTCRTGRRRAVLYGYSYAYPIQFLHLAARRHELRECSAHGLLRQLCSIAYHDQLLLR